MWDLIWQVMLRSSDGFPIKSCIPPLTFLSATVTGEHWCVNAMVNRSAFQCSCIGATVCCLHAVPIVLKFCSELIEMHGVVDGIYRLSGISSNIQRLRSVAIHTTRLLWLVYLDGLPLRIQSYVELVTIENKESSCR